MIYLKNKTKIILEMKGMCKILHIYYLYTQKFCKASQSD